MFLNHRGLWFSKVWSSCFNRAIKIRPAYGIRDCALVGGKWVVIALSSVFQRPRRTRAHTTCRLRITGFPQDDMVAVRRCIYSLWVLVEDRHCSCFCLATFYGQQIKEIILYGRYDIVSWSVSHRSRNCLCVLGHTLHKDDAIFWFYCKCHAKTAQFWGFGGGGVEKKHHTYYIRIYYSRLKDPDCVFQVILMAARSSFID